MRRRAVEEQTVEQRDGVGDPVSKPPRWSSTTTHFVDDLHAEFEARMQERGDLVTHQCAVRKSLVRAKIREKGRGLDRSKHAEDPWETRRHLVTDAQLIERRRVVREQDASGRRLPE